MPKLRDWVANEGVTMRIWQWPAVLGLGSAVLLWVVWYFTKAPCTMESANASLCNAGTIAGFIDHQILAQCTLLGLAVAAVKGGYNEIMVSRERKRADDAEQRLAEVQEQLRQERKHRDERTAEDLAERERRVSERERLVSEPQAEQEQREAALRTHWEELEAQARAERELDRAERQAILNNLVQINNALTQLLAERQNGRSSPEN